MRREQERLHLGPADIPALIRAATQLDPGRMSARAFPPAVRYIAAIGHVLRARRDPRAWIREMGFEIRIDELVIKGPEGEINELAHLIETSVLPSDLPLPLVFAYEDTAFDDNERHYAPAALVNLNSTESATLLAEPEARELMATHAAAITRGFAEFFDDWLEGHHLVIESAQVEGRVHGLRFEPVMRNERARRSHLEAPRPVARHGLSAIFSRASAEFDPYKSASLVDASTLRGVFERERERGAEVRADVPLRGESWRYLLVHPDGIQAVGISMEGVGYRFTGSMRLDERERQAVAAAPHASAGAPRG